MTRARRGEGELLRERILAAADRLLLSRGDADAVSMRDIARRVGCTPPALYLHFADKNELVFEVCSARFAEFDAVLAAASEGIDDPVQALRAELRAYVRHGLDNSEAYRVLFMAKPKTIPAGVRIEELPGYRGFARLVERVERLMASGVARPGDAVAFAIGLWSMAHGVTSLILSLPEFDWPEVDGIVEELADLASLGLLEPQSQRSR